MRESAVAHTFFRGNYRCGRESRTVSYAAVQKPVVRRKQFARLSSSG